MKARLHLDKVDETTLYTLIEGAGDELAEMLASACIRYPNLHAIFEAALNLTHLIEEINEEEVNMN